MLDLGSVDLDEVATALADQTDYEHRWLIDPSSGEIVLWTADTGIDGHTPVDPDELDLLSIDPLPSPVWYRDMAEFAERISDERAGHRLAGALQGKGAFRRFNNVLHQEYPAPAVGVVRLPRRPRQTPGRRLAGRQFPDRPPRSRPPSERQPGPRPALNPAPFPAAEDPKRQRAPLPRRARPR